MVGIYKVLVRIKWLFGWIHCPPQIHFKKENFLRFCFHIVGIVSTKYNYNLVRNTYKEEHKFRKKYYLELRLLFLVHFACTDDDSNVTHVIDKDLLMMLLQFNVDEIFECNLTLVVCNFSKNLQKSNFNI